MRTSLPAAPLVLAAIFLAAAALCCVDVAAADAVADSCNAIRDFVDASFCVSHLRAVPGAAAADRHGHLLMALDLAAAKGASAGNAAARMERAERDPAARDALRACGFLYGVASVPALRLMRGYAAARSWDAAHSVVMLALQAGMDCDAALGSSAAGNRTMAAANHEFGQLATMATALLNLVSSSN